ncbi:MAG TPA: TetR/AcrR family transcriptional regulator [Polaromonas sp.]|uniref:TetR/AcrR family transcriptional regulator n=1 Tax=Polaromonas sp. TaxID=1869339 RepID=UPI002D583E1C|nr:TetR/AcrR family transcriptional regulator [Polaromonas sp.]HYW55446.1 TetR/AcrR family transcriptional regulator [Polaromonas sp.]
MDATSTRSKLLDAATKVFLEHGLTAASMDMVRVEAGVSNGSLYHHFPTKALLADALYAHTLRDFHATLLTPITNAATAEAGVKGLVRAYIQWVLQHPEQARLLHKLRRNDGMTESGERGAANADAYGALAVWVGQQVEAGEMRAMPFAVWMALVFSPSLSLTQHWVAQDKPAVPLKVRAALEHGAWMAVAGDAP